MVADFEHTYASAFPELALAAEPEIPTATTLAWLNEDLAAQLGLDLDFLRSEPGLAWLSGASSATYALAYSGYQFGHLSPVLGDGRAHLLGELPASENGVPRVDVHLKGSGRTPFSRQGSDGKAPLSAVWREVVIGEALHALGVPTTRALAVLGTGESVRRRSPVPEPAGILVRVADSHVRVGTFQYAALHHDERVRGRLIRYALERHYPEIACKSENPALDLLRAVVKAQAELLARWMGLGFVHGVLNTDNVAVSGQALDFGPCAFIDVFSREAVYSSIDTGGRYRFGAQPGVTRWNLARFAEALLDLIDADNPQVALEKASFVLDGFEELYRDAVARVFAPKFGIALEGAGGELLDELFAFVERTFTLLEHFSLDFTGFFRALAEGREASLLDGQDAAAWRAELGRLREASGVSSHDSAALMASANPVYIPRNMALDAALRAVERGDRGPVERLLAMVREPFVRRPEGADLESAPPESRFFTSFCGT